jgi:hypothetical protein
LTQIQLPTANDPLPTTFNAQLPRLPTTNHSQRPTSKITNHQPPTTNQPYKL